MFNQNMGFIQSNQPYSYFINGAPVNYYHQQQPTQQYFPSMQVYSVPQSLHSAPPVNNYMVSSYPPNYRFQATPQQPQQIRFIPAAPTYAPKHPPFNSSQVKPSIAKSNGLLTVELHSSKAGHEKDKCTICRKATAELLRLPNPKDILPKSYEKRLDEYSLFKSDLKLCNNTFLQKHIFESSKFQFARNQRFSKESCIDSLDESWVTVSDPKSIEEALKKFALDKDRYSNATTIECEESQDAQSVQAENLDFKQQISPVTQNGLMKKFSTPITSASKDIMTVWKTPIVIDPSLSPRYDEVFPSLPLGEKKPCPRRVLRYNPAVSAKSRK